MKAKTRLFTLALFGAATVSGSAKGDVISNFDFTGPPWTAPKEADFNIFSANAQSVDTDANSITSPLTNNAGSGAVYDGGGYASFYVRDADLPTIVPGIFSTSATSGIGMNIANADYPTPTNYIAFKVLPGPGYETTYESLDFFSSSYLESDTYDIELRAVLAGSTIETTLGTYQRTMPAGNNNPVAAGSIDFDDFTASGPTEFRIYAYNIGQDNGGFRMDDLILNGVTSASGDASTLLIDHTFDGVANDIGPDFQQVTNGIGAGGSSNLSTGVITTGNDDSSTYGFNNVATVDVEALDPSAVGFVATYEVAAVGVTVPDIVANGLFFGLVSGISATGTGGSDLWNNDPDAFGYVAGSATYGDNLMRQDGTMATSATDFPLYTTIPDSASYLDGFTVSIRVFNDNTWWITSAGLSTELNQTGNLNTSDFSYADVINDLGLFVSLQGDGGGTIELQRATLRTISLPAGSSAPPEILSATKSGSVFIVQFMGVDGETYDLTKSSGLPFSTTSSPDSITLSGADTGVLQDTSATEGEAYYRVEQQ